MTTPRRAWTLDWRWMARIIALPVAFVVPLTLSAQTSRSSTTDGWVLVRNGEVVALGGRAIDVSVMPDMSSKHRDFVLVSRGDADFVIIDPATVASVARLVADLPAEATRQGAEANNQGELANERSAVANREGLLAAEQARLATRAAQVAAELARDSADDSNGLPSSTRKNLRAELVDLNSTLMTLNRQIQTLRDVGRDLDGIAPHMSSRPVLNEQRVKLESVLDEAIANGNAVRR